MEVKANVKNIRVAPRKVRLVASLVKGLDTNRALNELTFSHKGSAKFIAKLINSAVANAVNNFDLDKDNLYIKAISVDGGRVLKRWLPRARGRATPLKRKTSIINLVLAEKKVSGKKTAKKAKLEAPVKLEVKPKEAEGVKVKSSQEDEKDQGVREEKSKKIIDPRSEGRHKHAAIEGGQAKGFVQKIFRRKSG